MMVKKTCKTCGVPKSLCYFPRDHTCALGRKAHCCSCYNTKQNERRWARAS